MRAATWIKSLVAGGAIIVGGPILMNYVTPTEEELFKRYNPDLQKRSIEGREQRLKEANEFIEKIKEYSKSDKPVWTVWKEAEEEDRKRRAEREVRDKSERERMKEEMRGQRGV